MVANCVKPHNHSEINSYSLATRDDRADTFIYTAGESANWYNPLGEGNDLAISISLSARLSIHPPIHSSIFDPEIPHLGIYTEDTTSNDMKIYMYKLITAALLCNYKIM